MTPAPGCPRGELRGCARAREGAPFGDDADPSRLSRRPAEPGVERTRRLDSDAAAVQLVTIHASKGLEYPVVYVPALADRFVPKPTRPLFHDDSGTRCLDLGGSGGRSTDSWAEHCRRWADEEAGEWLRLLYVATTRAQSQVVAWWAPTKNAVASPLHRMLMREAGHADVPESPAVPDDDATAYLAPTLAARAASKAATRGPCASSSSRSAAVTAAMSSSSMRCRP